MASNEDEAEQIKEEISARINRIIPEELDPSFVNDMIIQHQPDFFLLSFFQYWPPAIIGGTNEERLEIARSIEAVDAKCVARLIITPEKMRRFLEVMTENMRKYDERAKSRKPTAE